MKPLEIAKLVAGVLLALAIGAGLVWAKSSYDELVSLRAADKEAAAVDKVANEIGTDLGVQAGAQLNQETDVATRRAALTRHYEDTRRANPAVATWADTPVPAELRDADRQAYRRPGDLRGRDEAAAEAAADRRPGADAR